MILALAALARSIRNVAGNNRRLQRGQNAMKNKKWKKFQLLTEECYNNMIGFGENNDCWKQAFELLMEIVLEERKQKRNLVKQLLAGREFAMYIHRRSSQHFAELTVNCD